MFKLNLAEEEAHSKGEDHAQEDDHGEEEHGTSQNELTTQILTDERTPSLPHYFLVWFCCDLKGPFECKWLNV